MQEGFLARGGLSLAPVLLGVTLGAPRQGLTAQPSRGQPAALSTGTGRRQGSWCPRGPATRSRPQGRGLGQHSWSPHSRGP